MSVNKYAPHVLVLPEDDANRKLANGFQQHLSLWHKIQVLPVAGGWAKVLDSFEKDHVRKMNAFPGRFMVLLIDFDGQEDRLDRAKAVIPGNLEDRVFVLGVWTEPQKLPAVLGSFESIGRAAAEDCRDDTSIIWGLDLLRHNASEIERTVIRP
jgi:hypothetical protein